MGNRKNEAVTLRQKPMRNGGYSLFLDIHENGRRRKEYIKLYLVPEETKTDRQKNKQTLQLAKAVAAKRLVEVHNSEYGFKERVRTGVVELYDDFVSERSKRDVRANTIKSYQPLRTYFIEYGWEDKDTSELTSYEINTFIDYLRKKGYSSCTLAQTASRIRRFLNYGIRKGLVNQRATDDLQKIQPRAKQREYLTIDEVRTLAKSEATSDNVKNAFLFSCLTGLRKSDIAALKWCQVSEENGMTRLIFTQKKTSGQMYLDITPEAVKYMGERSKANDFVFCVPSPHTIQNVLEDWFAKAGIAKRLTFHCARHTFATMMLELDVDIYVVSKLLGHTNVSTTQVYAKVVDKSKQNAVLRIPSIN